jgi:hypothetical protein
LKRPVDVRLRSEAGLIGALKFLDGGYLGAVDGRRKIETAEHREPVHQNGAAAAQSLAAGLARRSA